MEHRILLLKVRPATTPPRFVARPPYLVVDRGDSVRFINLTEAPVEIEFEAGALEPGTWSFGAGLEAKAFSVVATTSRRVMYFGRVGGSSTVNLEGESNPEIIIDRVAAQT